MVFAPNLFEEESTGRFDQLNQIIRVDYRLPSLEKVHVLAHELIHALLYGLFSPCEGEECGGCEYRAADGELYAGCSRFTLRHIFDRWLDVIDWRIEQPHRAYPRPDTW